MISCKTKLYQYHSFFNHVSLVCNTLSLFVTNFVSAMRTRDYELPFIVSCLLVVNKLALAKIIT